MCVESWGGPASCRYFRPPWAPGASHRATYISLVVISSLLIIVPFKQHENIAQAQAVQENQQQLISYPMYQDVQFGPAVGDENISNAPTQQAIDQQQRYLAYLIQQQQQRLKQQQVSMNPHTSFYSLVNEEPQGVQTNQNLASRPPSYGHTSVERPRLLRANNRLPSAALLPGGDQSRQQHQAVQMWRHKAHGNATPTVLTSMQLPDRAHHYKPPAPSTSIEHHPQVHEIDAHQYQYRPVREQKRQTFSPPLPVAAKPPLAVNLSSLLQPGEVMLSAREVHRPHTNRSPALVRNSTSIVSVREIESLLGRLKPLALSERDKATNLHQLVAGDPSGNANSTSDLGYDEEDQDQDREDESEMIGDNDQRPPELFALTNGGSGSRLTKSRKLPAGSVDQARGLPARARDYKDDEQMASFLQGLKSLGSELLDTDSVGGRETTAASSPDHERFYRHAAAPRASRHRGHATGSQRLPIELLVDHLMAGSRLATRSDSAPPAEMVNPVDDPENHRDHESLPIDYDYGGGGDDDDDDEDDPLAEEEEAGGDYEDSPEGGGLGANLMESEESARQETRVSVAPDPRGEEAAQADSLSAANSTAGDSWTPLVGVGNGPGDRQRQVGVAKRATSEVDAKSERKRRKRRRRRRRRDRASVMNIGNRNLSRQELIRLIRALNKMANDPRAPSDEREAGRRLLRHLIKLALANFKRQQQVDLSPTHEDRAERTRETNDGKVAMTNERLRESLRSMLIEPNLAASNDGGNSSSSSSKISIRMQPWRLKSPAALSTSRNALDEDEAIREPPRENGDDDDGETTRKKSLSEISDDLERYFDTDFFEDLADKDQKSNSSSGSTSSPGASNSKLTTSRRLRPEAAAVTNSPIVYGKRELEAADEDDVDLDHVRLTSPPPPPRSITTERTALESSKSEMGKSTKRPRRRRRRRRKNRRRRRRGKRPQPKSANERERDDDTEDEVTERRQEESKPVRVRARVKKQKPERQWQKKRKMQRDQGEDENESDEEQVAPAEDEKKENEQDDEDGKSSDRKQMETPKQDRGGKSQRRHKSGKRWNPSRDDVPAPIVAARMSKETTAKSRVKLGANKSKVRTTQDKSRPGNKSVSPDQVKKVESKKKGNRTRDKKVTPKKLAIGSEKNSAVSN